jgi:hypothetical protein
MTRPIIRGLVALAVGALGASAVMAGCGGDGNGGSSVTQLTGFQIVTGSGSSASGTAVSESTAACPSGKVVIGGGYTTGNQAANVYDSFPAAGGSGWTVGMKNENINVTTSITMSPVAVCIDRPAGYEIRDRRITLSSNQRGSVAATCTDATLTLVGGGWSSHDPIVTNFASTFDPSVVSGTTVGSAPTSWVSAFHSNHPIAASSGVNSYAICVANSAVSAGYLASPTTTIGTQSRSTLTQACDSTTPQTSVSSGGVEADVSTAVTFDSAPAGSGSWTAGVHNTSTFIGGLTVKARTLLVCVAATP